MFKFVLAPLDVFDTN